MAFSSFEKPMWLENNYVVAWPRMPRCVNCMSEFTFDVRVKQQSRRPHVLDCAHNICDKCLCLTKVDNIKCRDCKHVTRLNRSFHARENVHMNMYFYGALSFLKYDFFRRDTRHFDTTTVRSPMRKNSKYECSECNETFTDHFCTQCGVPYCKKCFMDIHKIGKTLQTHTLTLFGPKDSVSKVKCLLHRKSFALYCVDCAVTLCPQCAAEDHDGHIKSSISEQNRKSVSKLTPLIGSVKTAKEYIMQTLKDVSYIEKKQEQHVNAAIEDVSSFFLTLHGYLQLLEKNILLEIRGNAKKLLQRNEGQRNSLQKTFEEYEEVLSRLVNAQIYTPENYLVEDMALQINQKLKNAPNGINIKHFEESPFSVVKIQDAKSVISNMISVEMNPETYNVIFSDTCDTFDTTSDSLSISCTEQTANQDSSRSNNAMKKKEIEKHSVSMALNTKSKNFRAKKKQNAFEQVKQLKSVNSQKVHVAHIENPQCFYVQNQSFLAAANEFQAALAEEAEFSTSPSYVENNEMYLVLHSADQKWYRGIVTDINCSTKMYKVFLLDYGDTVLVPKQRLRIIPDDYKSRPAGSIKCSLYGIKPKAESWECSANYLMSEIILNQLVCMFIISEGNPHLVDLMTIHHIYPVSVRDALIFANEALYEEPLDSSLLEKINAVKDMKKKSKLNTSGKYFKYTFQAGESFRADVLRIISPEEFYIAKYDHLLEIKRIQDEMSTDYQKVREKIYLPQQGMICAAVINEVWHRVQISQVFPQLKCTVRLVDEAMYEIVDWKQLRIIDEKYISLNEAAIKCSLVDIAPLQQNGYAWTEECNAEFQRIVMNPYLQAFIHSTKDGNHNISLFVIKKNVDINVNALLVKYKHATSTGTESFCVEYPKRQTYEKCMNIKEDSQIDYRDKKKRQAHKYGVQVKMANIISPNEFYLKLIKQIPGIKTLHNHIQTRQKQKNMEKPPVAKAWVVSEKCLVQADLRNDQIYQWYRGSITDVQSFNASDKDSDQIYTVYLRDHGIFIENITTEMLQPIENLFDRVTDGAIKCSLACVQPTGWAQEWGGAAIDHFRVLVNEFEELGASIQVSRKGNVIPVILWGMSTECVDPLSAATCNWININKSFVNCGFATLSEKFNSRIVDTLEIETEMANGKENFSEWITSMLEKVEKATDQELVSCGEDLTSQSGDVVENSRENKDKIYNWLPPKPIDKSIFMCVPTYVDMQCVIYLHDCTQKRLMENIKHLINKEDLDRSDFDADEIIWSPGEPCLALYHLDNLFYRAVVVEVLSNKSVNVQFVDYGNVEECNVSDLRRNLMLTEIPIQANKYMLDGVKPTSEDSKWTTEILDFVHAQLVGKTCCVRVSENQENASIKKCKITSEGVDIGDLVSKMEATKNRGQSSVDVHQLNKSQKVKEKETVNYDPEDDIIIEKLSLNDKENDTDLMDEEDYRKIFEKIEFDTLCKAIENDEDDKSSESESVYSINSFTKSHNDLKRNIKKEMISPAEDTFAPNDTSTSCEFTELKIFKPLVLPHNVNGFYCETTTIIDSMDLYVCPYLSQYEKQFSEMSKRIQNLARTCKIMQNIEKNTPCLAKYKADGLWYRAVIREYCSDDDTVDVLYADYLNSETLSSSEVRECPKYLLEFPLRNIKVTLSNVRRNFRYRSSDIRRQLAKILDRKRIFVKVIENNEEIVAELYESHHEKCLLYEELIDTKFLLKLP